MFMACLWDRVEGKTDILCLNTVQPSTFEAILLEVYRKIQQLKSYAG